MRLMYVKQGAHDLVNSKCSVNVSCPCYFLNELQLKSQPTSILGIAQRVA